MSIVGYSSDSACTIEIAGPPKAQPRVRYYRKGVFNGAKKDIVAFRDKVRESMHKTEGFEGLGSVLFGKGIPVSLELTFYMRRPNKDFRHGERTPSMLSGGLPSARSIRPDIDNLVKFVMDALNGVFYDDDCQVVHLEVYKLLDNEGECGGRTIVRCSKYLV